MNEQQFAVEKDKQSGIPLATQSTGFKPASKQAAPSGSSFKDLLKSAKEAFSKEKGKFAEDDKEAKGLGEQLEKMNFDEKEEKEDGNEEIPELKEESKGEEKAPDEPMEQIQAILPQLDPEKIGVALELLKSLLEGKELPMAMQEGKPLNQKLAEKNPVNTGPAKFSEAKRIPAWMKIQMEEAERTNKEIEEVSKELRAELNTLKNEKKAVQERAIFSEEMAVALKNHPHADQLKESFTQVFSESGLKTARDTMKTVLSVTSKVPLAQNAKMPKRLNENMSQAHPDQIPELKKYASNPEHLKNAMKYAEIHRSRTNNTMSFGEYIDAGMKADFPELRGVIRGTATFTETAKE